MRVLVIGEANPEFKNPKSVSGGATRSTKFLSKVSKHFEKVHYIPSILGSFYHINTNEKGEYIEKIYRFSDENALEIPINLHLYDNFKPESKFGLRSIINRIARELDKYEYDLIYVTGEIPTDLDLATRIRAKVRGFIIHGSWIEGSFFSEVKLLLASHKCVNINILLNKMIEKFSLNLYFKRILSRNEFKFVIYINPNSLLHYNIRKFNLEAIRLYPGIAVDLGNNKNVAEYDSDTIISISTAFTPYKGICRLLNFLKLLNNENISLKLKLIGYMPKEFENKIRTLTQNNDRLNIQIFGKVNHDEALNQIDKSKVGINFSYRETYSFTTLELLANRVPVIMFKHNDLEEIYGNLKPVIFVSNEKELINAVKKLLSEDISSLFDEKVEKFLRDHSDWDRVISKEINIIKSFLPSY